MVNGSPAPASRTGNRCAGREKLWRTLILIVLVSGAWSVAAFAGGQPYDEPFRPQFHFTPRKNWMNDPNGLVYYKGEYHLFFQYNPFGNEWGHMSWGHAVSRDLVHWKQLPVAIPEQNGVMIFSGSAAQYNVRLFSSTDLKHWTPLSDFGPAGAVGGVWECPDLFKLPVENDPGQSRWVLSINACQPGH